MIFYLISLASIIHELDKLIEARVLCVIYEIILSYQETIYLDKRNHNHDKY